MANTNEKDRILDILLKKHKLTEAQCETVNLEKQNSSCSSCEALVKLKLISEAEIGAALSEFYDVPFVDLNSISITKEMLGELPEDIMRENKAIPVQKTGNELTVALPNPNDLVVLENLQIITGLTIKPAVAIECQISKVIEKYFSYDSMSKIIKESVIDKNMLSSMKEEEADVRNIESTGPVSDMINSIIEDAVKLRASDIHVEPQEGNIFIRYRIDGVLQTKTVLPKEIQPVVISRLKIMGNMDISEKRMPQDGQAQVSVRKRGIDLRLSTLPSKYGEKMVIRILDKSGFALGIENLGFMPEAQTKFEDVLNIKNGIILVTGPTGSGKSTTLYSVLNKLKSSTKNIITLEDPVEYELLSGRNKECGITQVQVNHKIGFTFSSALRASLRQDPDVILVGEIRDAETCSIAINAALMGHLVLSTLHTNDAVSTISRLLDMGVEPYLISEGLRCIVGQRLVRTLCQHCKEKYSLPPHMREKLKAGGMNDTEALFRAKGCSHCSNIGYIGRTAVVEILVMNQVFKEMILRKEPISVLREAAAKAGMSTMKQSALALVSKGMTTMAEVMRVVPSEA